MTVSGRKLRPVPVANLHPDTTLSRNPCLLTSPHRAHSWWYTSSGGGHMMWSDSVGERNTKQHRCSGFRDRGRWVVIKTPDPYSPHFPWKVILWGGNGEHWADGAEVSTWREAWDITRVALAEYRGGCYGDHRYQVRFERDYLS